MKKMEERRAKNEKKLELFKQMLMKVIMSTFSLLKILCGKSSI